MIDYYPPTDKNDTQILKTFTKNVSHIPIREVNNKTPLTIFFFLNTHLIYLWSGGDERVEKELYNIP